MAKKLWSKNGGVPQELPERDADATGAVWSDLANNPDGLAACGWAEAPEPPPYNPQKERLEWNDGAWQVTSMVPLWVSALQAELALHSVGKLDEVEAMIAQGGNKVFEIYWRRSRDFHRNHPVLLQMTSALGMSAGEVDQLFIAASQIT